MNKMILTAAILAGVIALGGGGAIAAGQIARSNAIPEETALNFACVDAGILPENVEHKRTEFDFEDGKFVYELEFISDGVKYEYTLESATGRIIGKGSERIAAGSVQQGADPAVGKNAQAPSEPIGVDKAKEIALEEAGLSAADVVFNKARLSREDGRTVYDIEFYIAGKAEYEYEIDAYSGAVLEKSYEELHPQGGQSEPARPPVEESRDTGSQPAVDPPTVPPVEESRDTGSQPAVDPPTVPPVVTPVVPDGNSEADVSHGETRREMISVEKAKVIALRIAGLSAEDVTFEKVKLEHDGGRLIYEVEFFVYGGNEYDCEIDAYSGTVVAVDIEPWDD